MIGTFDNDTIAAIATAPGQGGIAIVRLSGTEAERILSEIFYPAGGERTLTSHMLTYGRVKDGDEVLDECMAVLMKAPKSYTREDVAELQLHGGSFTATRVLKLCLEHGARLAGPGEFTRRAFLNGRIDLSQAEAVQSMIAANGQKAHRAAVRQLEGGASSFIRKAQNELLDIAAGVAACIDYPEEISEEEAASGLVPRLRALSSSLTEACDERAARILQSGLRVVLCGRPNVGKSSLLNALLGQERAIVTDIPGTTRDTVEGTFTLDGCEVRLTDTAGLRETEDVVEKLGVERSEKAMREADAVLLVLDASQPMTLEEKELIAKAEPDRTLAVLNKCDLRSVLSDDIAPGITCVRVSAVKPETLKPIREWLRKQLQVSEHLVLTQPRHLEAARRAASLVKRAAETVQSGMPVDLCTPDLQAAAEALAQITGDAVDEGLLDRVFSQFCVGK